MKKLDNENLEEVIDIKKISQVELDELLSEHERWIKNNELGVRPDLTDLNLYGLDFKAFNLYHSNLSGSNLSHCVLSRVNFYRAELINTDLSFSNVKEANFYRANLNGANLKNLKYDENTMFLLPLCPQEGSFIGFKRTRNAIVKLLIPEDAKRCSATTYRCRTNKVKVLEIIGLDDQKLDSTLSIKDDSFSYKLDEIISIENFDENNWNETSNGIHFFLTKDLALKY